MIIKKALLIWPRRSPSELIQRKQGWQDICAASLVSPRQLQPVIPCVAVPDSILVVRTRSWYLLMCEPCGCSVCVLVLLLLRTCWTFAFFPAGFRLRSLALSGKTSRGCEVSCALGSSTSPVLSAALFSLLHEVPARGHVYACG